MQSESEKRMTRLAETMTELASRTTRLEESMVALVDGLALLTRVTVDHAERIEKPERGPN
jgi:hypothetical protein